MVPVSGSNGDLLCSALLKLFPPINIQVTSYMQTQENTALKHSQFGIKKWHFLHLNSAFIIHILTIFKAIKLQVLDKSMQSLTKVSDY